MNLRTQQVSRLFSLLLPGILIVVLHRSQSRTPLSRTLDVLFCISYVPVLTPISH